MTVGTIVADNDAELVEAIDAAGLGPVSAAEVREVTHGPGSADTVAVLFVELDPGAAGKGRVLGRWLARLDVVDMVAGKFRAEDTMLRLNIRGRSPVGPVVVVAVFSERSETCQVELIRAEIGRQQPHRLVAALAALDGTDSDTQDSTDDDTEEKSVSTGSGGSSAKTSHQAGSPNHQNDSKETDV